MPPLCMELQGKSYEEIFQRLSSHGTCVTVEEYEAASAVSSRYLLVGSVLEMYPPVWKQVTSSGVFTKDRQVIYIKSMSPKKVGGRVKIILVGEIVSSFQKLTIKEKDVVCFTQPRISYSPSNMTTLSVGPGMTFMWYWRPPNGYNSFNLKGEPDPNEEPIIHHPPRPVRLSSPAEFVNTRLSLSRKGSVASLPENRCCYELFEQLPSLMSCCLHHTECKRNQSIANLLMSIVSSRTNCSEFLKSFQTCRPESPVEAERKKRHFSDEIPAHTDPKNLFSDDENFPLSECSSDLAQVKRRKQSLSPVDIVSLPCSSEPDIPPLQTPPSELPTEPQISNKPRFRRQLYSPRQGDD